MCLAAGKAGEVVVSGRHVLTGYLDGVGDEETKFRVNGQIWHRTGDSGYSDEMGRLWLLGRSSAAINDDRGELLPFAVECAARQFPAVVRAALVSRQGKRILFVQPKKRSHVDTDAVRVRLTGRGLTRCGCFTGYLDRRHNAKVDYASLAKIA